MTKLEALYQAKEEAREAYQEAQDASIRFIDAETGFYVETAHTAWLMREWDAACEAYYEARKEA